MVQNRVVVFSSRNIFTEGVVSRLRQHHAGGDIHFIDAHEEEFIARVADLSPDIVILDQAERTESLCCLLCDLLVALPTITIIRLRLREKYVQVVSGSTLELEGVADLVDLIWREEV